ncbi:MAG: GGDEF domain-containing protein [bacterium]
MVEPGKELVIQDFPKKEIDKLVDNETSEHAARRLLARQKAAEENNRQLDIDPLTGLYNRRWLDRELPKMFEKANQQNDAFTVLAIDIDFFKKINDDYGHPKGDEVLKNLAKVLKDSLRSSDPSKEIKEKRRSPDTRDISAYINGNTARTGGEEFLAVLSETKNLNPEQILGIANRLRIAIAKDEGFPEGISPTVSIGIATYDSNSEKLFIKVPGDLLKFADKALYNAKETGRNKVVMFTGLSQEGEPMFRNGLEAPPPPETPTIQ